MKKIMYLFMILCLSGCAGPGVFGIISAFDPDAEIVFQKRQNEILLQKMNKCLYDAVDNDTNEILCHAYDCECHENLINTTLSVGHVPNN